MRFTRTFLAAALIAAAPALHGGGVVVAQEKTATPDEQSATDTPQPERTSRPNVIERKLEAFDRPSGAAPSSGFGVTFGDIKRGAGASIGPAYRWTLSPDAVLGAKALYSIRHAKVVQVSLQSPPESARRLQFRTRARWQDVPRVPFHGLAPGVAGEEGNYSETMTEISGAVSYRPVRLVRLAGGAGFEAFRTAIRYEGDTLAALFTGVPGADANPRYLHSQVSAALDSRDSDSYPQRGRQLRATAHDYRQQNGQAYGFRRVDMAAEQYLPLEGRNGSFYLGLHASTTADRRGQSVPYFLMPELGGEYLRGFDTYRFRNRHSIVVSAEYQWAVQEYVDAAVFYDAGKAVAARRDLGLSRLRGAYGAGLRLHGKTATFLRVDVARSREGTQFLLSFGPVGG